MTAGTSASASAVELARESTGDALLGYLKTFSVALVVALAIAVLWPGGEAFSSVTQRLLGGFGGNTDVHASAAMTATNGMVSAPTAASGTGCCSSGSCSTGTTP